MRLVFTDSGTFVLVAAAFAPVTAAVATSPVTASVTAAAAAVVVEFAVFGSGFVIAVFIRLLLNFCIFRFSGLFFGLGLSAVAAAIVPPAVVFFSARLFVGRFFCGFLFFKGFLLALDAFQFKFGDVFNAVVGTNDDFHLIALF